MSPPRRSSCYLRRLLVLPNEGETELLYGEPPEASSIAAGEAGFSTASAFRTQQDPPGVRNRLLQGRSTNRHHSNSGAKQRGRSTEEEVCEILRDAVRSEPKKILPGRLFRGIGLEEDVGWGSQPAKPATFDHPRCTKVLSVMMRITIEPPSSAGFGAQRPASVWKTTITIFEIRFSLLGRGCRRDRLEDAFDIAIDEILGRRVLPLDRTAAAIAAKQRQVGRRARSATCKRWYWRCSQRGGRHTQHSPGILLVDPYGRDLCGAERYGHRLSSHLEAGAYMGNGS